MLSPFYPKFLYHLKKNSHYKFSSQSYKIEKTPTLWEFCFSLMSDDKKSEWQKKIMTTKMSGNNKAMTTKFCYVFPFITSVDWMWLSWRYILLLTSHFECCRCRRRNSQVENKRHKFAFEKLRMKEKFSSFQCNVEFWKMKRNRINLIWPSFLWSSTLR